MKNKKIVILYSDAKREYFPTEQQFISEVEVEGRAHIIRKYLEKKGFKVYVLPGNETVFYELKKIKPVLVINLVDSIRGEEYLASSIPAALELINVPYTGVGQLGFAISTNKFLTNKLLEQAGISVPKYQLFSSHRENISKRLKFPVISKLNSIHGSIEMGVQAISEDQKQLRKRLKYLIKTYNDDVLVSEYIDGIEVAAIILEGSHKKVYGGQKIFDASVNQKYKVASFDIVWGEAENRFHYEKYKLPVSLKQVIKMAYAILKVEDYAKFDIRITPRGKYYIIDANPNCSLGPKEAECDIGTILSLYGINFDKILSRIIKNNLV